MTAKEWNQWVLCAKLTGFAKVDKLIGDLGQKGAKLYDKISIDFLVVMTSNYVN